MEPREVPFFNYPNLYTEDRDTYLKIFDDVCSRGAFIMQKDILEFEEQLAQFINVKHAIAVADGTNALQMALWAAEVGPGDEVILPSHTFIATAGPVHHCGATPVLVECGPDHLIDGKAVKEAITTKTKAIMPVQLNGRTCNMDPILELAQQHGLHIIEDSAQALGSRYKDKYAGTFGFAGSFSFYPAKSLGCFGDGGAVVTNHDDVAEKLRLMRDHGRLGNDVVLWGTNSRLDNLQAAFLKHKLNYFPAVIERRRQMARQYQEGLQEISQLILPPAPNSDGPHFDTFQNYEIEADRRDDLEKFLHDNGVKTIRQWGGKAVHQFTKLGFTNSLPYTEKLMDCMLMLPLNMSLTDEDIEYVIATVKRFYQ